MDSSPPAREPRDSDDEISLVTIVRTLVEGKTTIAMGVIGITLVVALGAGAYFLFLQPTRWVSTLSFRLTFDDAAQGRYPNALPFAPSDILSTSTIEQVVAAQAVGDYCTFAQFRQGLVVERGGTARRLLDAQYEVLLAASRQVSPVERQQLEEEYQTRLAALPLDYRLVFVRPSACGSIPSDVIAAALNGILEAWAQESELKRGVLRYQVAIVGPSIFDQPGPGPSIMLQLDLARTASRRAIEAVELVSQLPGAASLRSPTDGGMSLTEIRNRLIDLQERVIQPLFIAAARNGLDGASRAWVEEARQNAELQQMAALDHANTFRDALREFSGSQPPPNPMTSGNKATPLSGTGEAQTVIPQLDDSFIERIVQLSTQASIFRQKLTRSMVKAGEAAAEAGVEVAYYAMVLEASRTGRTVQRAEMVQQQLDGVIQEGKRLVGELNAAYEELGRVGLRPGAALYVPTDGTQHLKTRPFSSRDLLVILATTFVASLFLFTGGILVKEFLLPGSKRVA